MMAQTRDWTSEIQKSVKNTARMSIKDWELITEFSKKKNITHHTE